MAKETTANRVTNLPFAISVEKAKHEIVNAINVIGQKYGIPSSILNTIVEQIVIESKLSTLQSVVALYDMSIPEVLHGEESPVDS